jgi:hypothetical protein
MDEMKVLTVPWSWFMLEDKARQGRAHPEESAVRAMPATAKVVMKLHARAVSMAYVPCATLMVAKERVRILR